jgi:hypothetical protein
MNKLILVIIILVILSCCNSKRDYVLVNFKPIDNCNENGLPSDSTIGYYPIDIFSDSLPGFFNGYGIIPRSEKSAIVKYIHVDPKTLKDTFYVEMKDTQIIKLNSYMYFKMNEPVLHSHYLGKDIYRLTSIRSKSESPLVVSIEKTRDSIVLITKMLDRRISYPFIRITRSFVYFAPGKPNREMERIAEQKRLNDSIERIYNNCNYNLVLNKRVRISKAVWDTLEAIINSTDFWKKKSMLDLSGVECDDSKMIFEGHIKEGYQIRIIPSLHLYRERYSRPERENYDLKNENTKIFRYIMGITGLKDCEIY